MEMAEPNSFLFLDIDTQKDLIEHFGAKAIPDCPEIRENLMDLMSFAMRNQIPILSPVLAMPEGDYCVVDTPGAEKVLDAECERWTVANSDLVQQDWTDLNMQQVVFPHEEMNPLAGLHLLSYIKHLSPQNIVIFGVPLEISVRMAVETLAKETDCKIWLVKDAVKGYVESDDVLQKLRQFSNVSLMSTRNTIKYLAELAYGANQSSQHE